MFVRALLAAGGLRGLFIKLDLVFTVVDGQKPRCVKAAMSPDFLFFFCKWTVPSQLSGLGRTAPVYIKVRPDLAYQMRFGLTSSGHQTAGSPPPRPHKSSTWWNLQQTKMPEKLTLAMVRISAWTSWPGRGPAAAAARRFQRLPIMRCVGERSKPGRAPNSIFYQTNQTFDRPCLPRAHQFLIFSVHWFMPFHLRSNI